MPKAHSRSAAARSTATRALRARDAGLRRISTATRALVAGSVVAAGAFSALAAWAQPGRARTLRPSTGSATAGHALQTNGGAQSPSGSEGGDDVVPPTTLPSPVTQYTPPAYQYSPPVVVSGAS